MQFDKLNLHENILKALNELEYEKPTPIQSQAIPEILAKKDVLGCAQTGTGKTAAFAIPILQHLSIYDKKGSSKKIKSLILAPTRELALQIEESFDGYGKHLKLRHLAIFGGVSRTNQINILRTRIDILIATPGRLLDFLDTGIVDLSELEIFVLDEADKMLDMGFIDDIKRVVAKIPKKRQTLLFSATMPKEIKRLANDLLESPVNIAVSPESSTVEEINQELFFVDRTNKRKLLQHIVKSYNFKSILIFTRTKHGANRIVRNLTKTKKIAEAIHSDKSQNQRQNALKNFKEGKIRILVATDIASRGIDIEELSCVINYDLPDVAETYVHRIGRTGRAGLGGVAISICDKEDMKNLRNIQDLIGDEFKYIKNHPFTKKNLAKREAVNNNGNAHGSSEKRVNEKDRYKKINNEK